VDWGLRIGRVRRLSLAVVALIASSALGGAAQPSKLLPARAGSGLIPTIEALATSAFPNDRPGAIVLAAKDGRAIFKRAYGLADLEFSTMLEPDMLMRIGSITKQFTAGVILRLVELGKLRLTETVSTYLPDYPETGRTITIEHLLTHTSGLPNFTALPEYVPGQPRRLSVDALLGMFKDRPLEFTPGTRFAYSNSGYAVLGAIIEKVTKQTYADALREYILVPIAARDTHYDSFERILPRRVHGYEPDGTGYRNAPYLDMSQPFAAGALVSTADDLLTWDTALTSGRILKPESLEKMMTPFRLSDGTTSSYGYGWALIDYEGHAVAEHSGGINGFRSHVVRIADAKVYVAVLSNDGASGRRTQRLARKIASLLVGAPLAEPPATAFPPSVLDQFVGRYVFPDNRSITIARDGDHLRLEGGTGEGVLYSVRGDQFHERGGVAQFTFQRDGDGRVAGVEQSGWGAPERGTRER
jgi:CubicO group peptidase (beta-lactamase class C family)